MQFSDSETQKMIRNTARSYLADRYPWERLYAVERGDTQVGPAGVKEMAEMGWLALLAPESAGGGGVSLLEAAVVIDECGYAGVPAPLAVSNIAADLISRASGGASSHLAVLASGQRLYTVSEATRRRGRSAHAGAKAGRPLSAAGGNLSGTLPLVPFGDVADFALAPLTVDGEPAFGVIALAGARREPVRMLDRLGYCNIHIDNADLSDAVVLARGKAAGDLHERCDALVTGLSLIELGGMMQRVLEMTSEYISNRVQFGQPIAKFQAARHRAAELLTQTETVRWTAYYGLWSFERNPAQAEEIWLAKHWAIRAADRVFHVSHLLTGGVGVGTEYPLHLFTQAIAAYAVRGGAMNEMVNRTLESLNLRAAPASGR